VNGSEAEPLFAKMIRFIITLIAAFFISTVLFLLGALALLIGSDNTHGWAGWLGKLLWWPVFILPEPQGASSLHDFLHTTIGWTILLVTGSLLHQRFLKKH
jgi:hypothetical protein